MYIYTLYMYMLYSYTYIYILFTIVVHAAEAPSHSAPLACVERRPQEAHVRRRHACHMRRRIHTFCPSRSCGRTPTRSSVSCKSYEEEDTCMSYEEEDTCMSYEEGIHACHMRRRIHAQEAHVSCRRASGKGRRNPYVSNKKPPKKTGRSVAPKNPPKKLDGAWSCC